MSVSHGVRYGITGTLVLSIVAAVLGMFQFGYNIGVINAPQTILEKFISDVYRERSGEQISKSLRDWLWAIAVSVFAIGGMVGGISGGMVANRFGRKGGMLMNVFLGIPGGLFMALTKTARSIELLILGRLVIGVNCGLSTGLVPMYLLEIAPMALRGGLGTLSQLGVTVGLLLSQILGIHVILGTEERWPFLLGVAVVPPALQLLLLPACNESPRYLLITKQQESQARKALQSLRRSDQVEEEIEEMKKEDEAHRDEPKVSMLQVLTNKVYRLPLAIGLMMHLSQQFSGINAVFFYSVGMFVAAGLSEADAKYANMGVGLIMVVMTVVSIPLMDKAGRRTLHLLGLGGMFVFSILMTFCLLAKSSYQWVTYLSVVSTLCYVVFFAIGPGTIPWMLTAELFPQGPRPAAMSIGVLVNWSASFLVGLIFPPMQEALRDYSFVPFTGLLGFFWIFTFLKVPETKNKTFEEIAAIFRKSAATVSPEPAPAPPAPVHDKAGTHDQAPAHSVASEHAASPGKDEVPAEEAVSPPKTPSKKPSGSSIH